MDIIRQNGLTGNGKKWETAGRDDHSSPKKWILGRTAGMCDER